MADAQTQRAGLQAQDILAIEALIAAQAEAWNRGDAKAFSAGFAADGGFVNVLGMVFYGRDAFEQRHKEMFETIAKGSRVKMSIRKLRFVRSDVAVADVDCELTGRVSLPAAVPRAPDGSVRSMLQLVLVRESGAWWITAFHNVAVAPLRPPT